MSETRGGAEGGGPDASAVNSTDAADTAREGIEDVERGDAAGATAVNETERAHPEDAEAVEQERSDGPPGRGVER
jgi:hypothetical protein